MAKKEESLSFEERLEKALVPHNLKLFKIPSNWQWVRLGCLGYTNIGLTYKPSDVSTNGVIVLRSSNIQNGVIDYNDIIKVNIDIPESKMSQKGDILVCARNGSKALVGKTAIIEADGMSYGAFMAIFRSEYNRLIYYYLNSSYFRDLIDKEVGTTTINQVTQSIIKELPFPLPPLAEQQRIVDCIDSLFEKLNNAKELAQNALDTFETRKAAILHKAFTGELTAKWREKNGVGMDSWEECQLQDACIVNPKRVDIRNVSDDVEVTFIPMPAVSEIKGAIVKPEVKSLGEVKKGYTNFSQGDVIFAKITPCMENGKSAVVGELLNNIGFGSTEFHVLRCSEKLDNQFLYHIVRNQSFRDEAKAVMTGAVGQQRVPKTFLEEYPLHLPSLPEQQEIVRVLDSLFEKEQKAKELCDVIDKIELMKKAILARAFRGELGTNDPNEESAICLLKEVLMNQ